MLPTSISPTLPSANTWTRARRGTSVTRHFRLLSRRRVNEQVENALFKSCLGYNAQIVKHYKLKTVEYDPETGKRIREVETLVEARDEVHVAANTAAQMFWLTNRKPETWKYKPEAQDGDEDEGSGVVLLSPVMDNPGPPTEGGANDG